MFDTPFEQRRLRLLNVLFLAAVARCGDKPEVRGQEAREISITVYQTTVALPLDQPKVGRRGSGRENSSNGKFETLRLAIDRGYQREEGDSTSTFTSNKSIDDARQAALNAYN